VISAEILLERLSGQQLLSLWPLVRRWERPAETLEAADELTEILRWVDRDNRAERLLEIAARVADTPQELDNDTVIRTLLPGAEAVADLAVLTVPSSADDDDAEEPVLAVRGVLRVAARFTGEQTLGRKNRMTDGRLAVARMIGYGENARDAHLGLLELAAGICRPEAPACFLCPLAQKCASAKDHRASVLF